MIRYVKLENYKSLVNLYVNFMKTNTKPKNLILIYGENGVGKSNFVSSFYTLNEFSSTMSSIRVLNYLMEENKEMLKEKKFLDFFENDFKPYFKDTETIIKNYKTIGSKNNMVIEFGFLFKNKNGVYRIETNDKEIVKESLDYTLNKNQTNYFELTSNSFKINQNIFEDKEYYNEFKKLLKQYWGKHSLLSIIYYEMLDKKDGYVDERISNNFYQLLIYLRTMCVKTNNEYKLTYGITGVKHPIMSKLSKGKVPLSEENELNKIENILNEILTNLYSDIKKVYYKKEYAEDKIEYKLILTKLIYGRLIDVDFKLESSGTKNIISLLPYLISACEGQTVVIDEFDSEIHDVMIKKILESVYAALKGQLIITTHNTTLFESEIQNENIYVFNTNKDANKELLAITEFNGRIHQNNNPRKKYLSGMYGGVPIVSDIDFEELIDMLD